MKKLVLAFVLAFGLTAFAQQGTTPTYKSQMKKMTPAQRQEAHLKKLTEELTLTTPQQDQVSKILAEKGAKMQELKTEQEVLRKKFQAERADYDSKMKVVLTAEQYAKWLTMKEENKDKMMEMMYEKKEKKSKK